ncbi:MAG: hypothetical protein KF709_06240 [Gemmatimonadaceae bacterium]|nr:hypothetical protein [Gemmatimonadaceae bacterium]
MRNIHRVLPLAALALATAAPQLRAQDDHSGPRARKVISIGNYPRVDGIRINFRDRELDRVRGANITIWSPYDDYIGGTVTGAAIGLPITAAENIYGVSFGIFGVAAENDMTGINFGGVGVGAGGTMSGISFGLVGAGAGNDVRGAAVGGIGVGAGGSIRGVMLGGVGAGAGGELRGLALGGVGAAAGGDVRGILAGGIGAGAGGDLRGAAIGGVGVGAGGSARGLLAGGIGVGAGGSVRGIAVGGVGVGAGGSVRGIAVGGIGVGAGGGITGLSVGGVGVGSGGTLRWVSIGGVGVGAPRIEGLAVASMVGAETTQGVIIAPILFRTERGGQATGVNVSSVNAIRGFQQGVSIGLVNYAERLRGIQLGAVNIVRDNPAPFKVLPLINFGRE